MIHPSTTLRHVNADKGRGIFATSFIPKGTMTYVKDRLEVSIPPDDPVLDDPGYADIIDTYTYIDRDGSHVLSWDHAKYVNHCCRCNTISTGYGFEIAIRDIHPGEELTDEYGLFNLKEEMQLSCTHPDCRKKVTPSDPERYSDGWDKQILEALRFFETVEQPLIPFLEQPLLEDLRSYLRTGEGYRSVRALII